MDEGAEHELSKNVIFGDIRCLACCAVITIVVKHSGMMPEPITPGGYRNRCRLQKKSRFYGGFATTKIVF